MEKWSCGIPGGNHWSWFVSMTSKDLKLLWISRGGYRTASETDDFFFTKYFNYFLLDKITTVISVQNRQSVEFPLWWAWILAEWSLPNSTVCEDAALTVTHSPLCPLIGCSALSEGDVLSTVAITLIRLDRLKTCIQHSTACMSRNDQ